MPSPALIAFCVFAVISFVAITTQLCLCIRALRTASTDGSSKPPLAPSEVPKLNPKLTAAILDAGADLEAPPPRTPDRRRSPGRRYRTSRSSSYRNCPPLSPVREVESAPE